MAPPSSGGKGSTELDSLVTLAQMVLTERTSAPASAEVAQAALELARMIMGNLGLLGRVLERLGNHALLDRLLDLPTALSLVNETELALSVAKAFAFIAPDKMNGDKALIYANAGRREEALAQIGKNLDHAADVAVAEAKAGDGYRALGEHDAAEVYYRRSLAEAKSPLERAEAVLRITSLLVDCGREKDARAFIEHERESAKQA